MKITKIKVSIGRTINLGNYESARIDIGLEAEASGDIESIDEFLIDQLHQACLEKLNEKIDKKEY